MSVLQNCVFGSHDEAIINLVKERPYLYMRSRADYRDNGKRDNAFGEIGKALDMSGKEAKGHWRSLRDRYTREKRTKKWSKWKYFPMMTFLDEHLTPRRSYGNAEDSPSLVSDQAETSLSMSVEYAESVHNTDNESLSESDKCSAHSTSVPVHSEETSPKRRRKQSDTTNFVATLQELGKAITSALVPQQEEDDEAFERSVTQRLKRLSPKKNSLAKIKILEVLHEIEFELA